MPKLRLVEIDDWCALYKDGKSIYQGHSVHSVSHFLEILEENGIKLDLDFATIQGGPEDEAAAHDNGQLPQHVAGLRDTKVES